MYNSRAVHLIVSDDVIKLLGLSRSLPCVCELVIKSKQQPVDIGSQISCADLMLRKHDQVSFCRHGCVSSMYTVGKVSILFPTISLLSSTEVCVCLLSAKVFSF
jgi:hypothetical protein